MSRKTLDWNNDMVLEFIAAYSKHPILYDPKDENYTRKGMYIEAWNRIRDELSWDCTVDDLKRKKDSLMAYYRLHCNKIKKMREKGGEFVTTWFAFEALNSFLGKNYDVDANVESTSYFLEEALEEEYDEENIKPIISTAEGCYSDNESHVSEHHTEPFRQMIKSTPKVATKIKYEYNTEETKSSALKRMCETELYTELLKRKLMKLDEEVRLTLMNNIDNLVFNATVDAKKREKLRRDNDPLNEDTNL